MNESSQVVKLILAEDVGIPEK